MSRRARFISIHPIMAIVCLAAFFSFAASGSCLAGIKPRIAIDTVVVGPLKANCYLVYDRKSLDAIVIDPGAEPDKIISAIERKRLKVRSIVLTHGHFDHVGGVALLRERTDAPVLLHKKDLALYGKAKELAGSWGFAVGDQPGPDRFLIGGDKISAGKLRFRVIAVPGHSPGGICIYGEGVVFTGDTIFAGSVGRTDLPGGSMQELKRSFLRIMDLPAGTKILPGHGGESTVAEERRQNPF